MLGPARSTKSAMFGLLLALVTVAGLSCSTASTPQETEGFEAGTGDSFGTLNDPDAGTFEIGMGQDGAISSINVEAVDGTSGGEVSLPSADDPSLSIIADTGGTLEITQQGDTATLSLDDPELATLMGQQQIEVTLDGAAAGGVIDALSLFLSASQARLATQSASGCAENRKFIDDYFDQLSKVRAPE